MHMYMYVHMCMIMSFDQMITKLHCLPSTGCVLTSFIAVCVCANSQVTPLNVLSVHSCPFAESFYSW